MKIGEQIHENEDLSRNKTPIGDPWSGLAELLASLIEKYVEGIDLENDTVVKSEILNDS